MMGSKMVPIPDIMKMKMNAFGRPPKFKSGRRDDDAAAWWGDLQFLMLMRVGELIDFMWIERLSLVLGQGKFRVSFTLCVLCLSLSFFFI